MSIIVVILKVALLFGLSRTILSRSTFYGKNKIFKRKTKQFHNLIFFNLLSIRNKQLELETFSNEKINKMLLNCIRTANIII